LAVLWIVKTSLSSLAIPFFVLLLIPVRFLLNKVFSQKELEALEGVFQSKVDVTEKTIFEGQYESKVDVTENTICEGEFEPKAVVIEKTAL
jgi:hypothetical protein